MIVGTLTFQKLQINDPIDIPATYDWAITVYLGRKILKKYHNPSFQVIQENYFGIPVFIETPRKDKPVGIKTKKVSESIDTTPI